MKIGRVMDSINVDKLKRDVESTIDAKTNGLLSDFKSGNLDPEKLEGQISAAEKAIEPLQKASSAIETYKKVKDLYLDPVGAIKKEATERAKSLITEKLSEVPQIQEIKDQVYQKVRDKIMEIPQVQEIVDEAEKLTDQQFSTGAPSEVGDAEGIGNSPENYKPSIPSMNALIGRMLRESGVTQDDLRS